MPLAPALRRLAGEGPNRGSIILLSDLMTPDWQSAIDGLGVGAGGVVLHVLGQEELDPQLAGDLRLADAETGSEVPVSTSEETMRRYRAALERFAQEAAGRARRVGPRLRARARRSTEPPIRSWEPWPEPKP